MISIIICSRHTAALRLVTADVAVTIGVPYEIVSIDNSTNKYSICEAYNIGASQSKFNILCFMHEDICFHTANWGQSVCRILADESIGLIGVAGAVLKTKAPGPWWEWQYDTSIVRKNIIQHYGDTTKKEEVNPLSESISDVVTIDGVWMCCRKQTWLQNKFDSKTFKGFHFYDLDFSMQVLQKERVCVVYDIDIEHFSAGSRNISLWENAVLFVKKWKKKLPVYTTSLNKEEIKKIESTSYRLYIKELYKHGFNKHQILLQILKLMQLNLFNKSNFLYLKKAIKLYVPSSRP